MQKGRDRDGIEGSWRGCPATGRCRPLSSVASGGAAAAAGGYSTLWGGGQEAGFIAKTFEWHLVWKMVVLCSGSGADRDIMEPRSILDQGGAQWLRSKLSCGRDAVMSSPPSASSLLTLYSQSLPLPSTQPVMSRPPDRPLVPSMITLIIQEVDPISLEAEAPLDHQPRQGDGTSSLAKPSMTGAHCILMLLSYDESSSR